MKIGFVSLGCPKNQLDTEVMLHNLHKAGFEVTFEVEDVGVVHGVYVAEILSVALKAGYRQRIAYVAYLVVASVKSCEVRSIRHYTSEVACELVTRNVECTQ